MDKDKAKDYIEKRKSNNLFKNDSVIIKTLRKKYLYWFLFKEKSFTLFNSISRTFHIMTNRFITLENFIIISTFISFVTKK